MSSQLNLEKLMRETGGEEQSSEQNILPGNGTQLVKAGGGGALDCLAI
jgi:hypothetical protein